MWDYILIAVTFVAYLYLRFFGEPNSKLTENASSPVVKTFGILENILLSINFSFDKCIPNYEKLDNTFKTYGPIFSYKLGFFKGVNLAVGDLTTARKIMTSPNWINRFPDDHYLHDTAGGKPLGLIYGGGDYWKESRKLAMKIFHQIDFYKSQTVEAIITPELDIMVNSYLKQLRTNNGEFTLHVENTFEFYVLNITSKLLMSKRFEYDDPLVVKYQEMLVKNSREYKAGASPVDVMSWLRHIPGLTWVDANNQTMQAACNLFLPEITKKRQTGSYRTNPRDFADYFLCEIDKQRGQEGTLITDDNFIISMRDIFLGGSDSSSLTIEHGLLHLALQTEVQKKMQTEIDAVIGPYRSPTFDDRQKMNYTQAVILETLRIATTIPLTTRSAINDTTLYGHFFPKGTLCGINLYSINRNPENWPEPDAFRPERFLNDQGEIINADKIMTFGHGKRSCLGVALAHVFEFLCFVRLLQKFSFRISNKHPPPSLKNRFGLSRGPLPFYLTVRERNPSKIIK